MLDDYVDSMPGVFTCTSNYGSCDLHRPPATRTCAEPGATVPNCISATTVGALVACSRSTRRGRLFPYRGPASFCRRELSDAIESTMRNSCWAVVPGDAGFLFRDRWCCRKPSFVDLSGRDLPGAAGAGSPSCGLAGPSTPIRATDQSAMVWRWRLEFRADGDRRAKCRRGRRQASVWWLMCPTSVGTGRNFLSPVVLPGTQLVGAAGSADDAPGSCPPRSRKPGVVVRKAGRDAIPRHDSDRAPGEWTAASATRPLFG